MMLPNRDKKVSVYLDTCALQRPLDTLSQTRLRLEAEAILGILALIEAGEVTLVSSTPLEIEASRNPLAVRKEHANQVLNWASSVVVIDNHLAERASEFTRRGIKGVDALHLVAAEAAKADYFCTCDDRFLRNASAIDDLRTNVVSPLELIERLES
jgi:predicted nucleic acid-binding protein